MTIGDKIKKIRTFRKMTQAELGAALGWGEKGANRLAQYETNYRVPKKELVAEMAKILDVNPWTLYDATTMDATEFMELLFWIDEFNPSAINLFQMETYPGEKCTSSEDTSVRYHDNDSWPAHPPVGLQQPVGKHPGPHLPAVLPDLGGGQRGILLSGTPLHSECAAVAVGESGVFFCHRLLLRRVHHRRGLLRTPGHPHP